MNPFFMAHGKPIQKILMIAGAVIVAAGWVRTVIVAAVGIPFRYAHNYAEPAVAAILLNIPRNPLLYHDFQHEPFIVNPYNPVYIYLSYAASWVIREPMAAGRVVSFAAGLAVCALIFLILRRIGVSRLPAFIFAALFVQMPSTAGQWATMRPDVTGLAFSLAGIYCLLRYETASPRRPAGWLGAGIACFVLAFFTKQNFLAGPACYFLYLASERRAADLVRFSAVFAAGLFLPTLVLNHLTGGTYLMNQLMSVKKPFFAALFAQFWSRYLIGHAALAALAAAAFIWGPRRGVHKMLLFYAVLAALSTVTLGKIGADINYFLEPSAAICILGGVFAGAAVKHRGPVFGALLAAALLQTIPLAELGKGVRFSGPKTPELDRITAWIRQTDGPVFAENMGLLIAAGKPVVYAPFEFTQLADAGVWDENKVLSKLERREFAAVILETNLWKIARSSRFTPAFVSRVRTHYSPVARIGGQIICVPKKGPDA